MDNGEPNANVRIEVSLLQGEVAPGFEEVASEFEKNFAQRGEVGAACAIYHEGRKVVDLWGGYRDRETLASWEEDTLVLVFSATKGISALTVALAHSRGLIDYDEKVATIEGFTPFQMLLHMNTMPVGMVLGYMNPRSLTRRTFGNPKLRSPADFNRPEYRVVELPAGNGIGQVRSMAKAYGVFAAGGRELGIGEETLEALAAPPTPPSLGSRDEVLKAQKSYSLGFNRPSGAFRFGSGEKCFGTIGAGGSFGFADPEVQVGFAYAPNKMGFHVWDDPREKVLRDAVYRCL
jgi:CubicO group peptidase (beta-lactamase class C family)